jgi:hypothetical protein
MASRCGVERAGPLRRRDLDLSMARMTGLDVSKRVREIGAICPC